jgi:hypothetical protein
LDIGPADKTCQKEKREHAFGNRFHFVVLLLFLDCPFLIVFYLGDRIFLWKPCPRTEQTVGLRRRVL